MIRLSRVELDVFHYARIGIWKTAHQLLPSLRISAPWALLPRFNHSGWRFLGDAEIKQL